MSSGLNHSDDRAYEQIAFNGSNGLPWHGMGEKMAGLFTTDEAVRALPGVFSPIELVTPQWKGATSDEIRLVVRDTVCMDDSLQPQILGSVGKQYQVLQNEEILRVIDDMQADKHGAKIETCGELYDGSKFFFTLKLPDEYYVTPDDKIDGYLFGIDDKVGRHAFRMHGTTVRVVCANTAKMARDEALAKNLQMVTVRHSGDVRARMESALQTLGIARVAFENTISVYQALSKREVSDEEVTRVLEMLYPDTKNATGKNQRTLIQSLYDGAGMGAGMKNVAGTAWGMFNAVTQFEDHERNKESEYSTRFFTSLFDGTRKDIALDTIRKELAIA